MPKFSKSDNDAIENFGFEFSEPPTKADTRRSKHDERWLAARALCMKNPGKPLKVLSYTNPSQPYNTARKINNGEHRYFVEDSSAFTAVAGKINEGEYAIWLTYNGE